MTRPENVATRSLAASTAARTVSADKHVGLEADIRFEWPDGTRFRRRFRARVNTENQAKRWAEDLERRLYVQGPKGLLARSKRAGDPTQELGERKEVPTLSEFWPTFISAHCEANRHKPSGIARKESVYKKWLKPRLGGKRLDQIAVMDIAALKADLAKKSAKSANNVLTALSACLKFAGPEGLRRSEGLGIIERVPRIKLLAVDSGGERPWYEVHEYKRIVEAAEKLDSRIHLLVLLGGSAGLRRGEIVALKWTDLDLKRRIIHVRRSILVGEGAHAPRDGAQGGEGARRRHDVRVGRRPEEAPQPPGTGPHRR